MRARLVALYPAAWRARYGEELAALLESQSTTPAGLVNVILGALDAHLLGEKGVSSIVAKWRTPAAISITLGGFLWFAGRFGGNVASLWPAYLVEATGMFIAALGIVGLARLPERARPLSIGVGSLAVAGLLLTAGEELVAGIGYVLGTEILLASSWLLVYVVFASLAAQAVFALVVGYLGALPRAPLTAIAAAALGLVVAANIPSGPDGFASTCVQWLVMILPLCWAALGVTMLVVPARRQEPVAT